MSMLFGMLLLPYLDKIVLMLRINSIYVFLSNFLLVAKWVHTVNKHTPLHTGFSKIDQSVCKKNNEKLGALTCMSKCV